MSLYLSDYLPLLERAEQCEHLSPNEEEFLQGLRDRQEQYGDGTYISEKQLEWLKQIAEKE